MAILLSQIIYIYIYTFEHEASELSYRRLVEIDSGENFAYSFTHP